MRSVDFYIVGTPAPQGSKKGFYNKKTGRVQMVESSKQVRPWRNDVMQALFTDDDHPQRRYPKLEGPVMVQLDFYFHRPASHYGTGRNSGVLKKSAPRWPSVRPDLDKLARSTLDGLGQAGLFEDDSRVVEMTLIKHYAFSHESPGCRVRIWQLDS